MRRRSTERSMPRPAELSRQSKADLAPPDPPQPNVPPNLLVDASDLRIILGLEPPPRWRPLLRRRWARSPVGRARAAGAVGSQPPRWDDLDSPGCLRGLLVALAIESLVLAVAVAALVWL